MPSALASKLSGQLKGRDYGGGIDGLIDEIKKSDPAGARAARKAFNDVDRVSTRRLAEILTESGFPINQATIAKWRKKERG